jgi:hypothetical protein
MWLGHKAAGKFKDGAKAWKIEQLEMACNNSCFSLFLWNENLFIPALAF